MKRSKEYKEKGKVFLLRTILLWSLTYGGIRVYQHKPHTNTQLSYLLLLHVCFLALVSEGLGGEVSWFAIGWNWLCAESAALSLVFHKGTQVTVVDYGLFWLVNSSPERNKLCMILDAIACYKPPYKLCCPCVRALPQSIIYRNFCNTGDTNRALCLSSARIWSLGFRVYLQIMKGGKQDISFCKSLEIHTN